MIQINQLKLEVDKTEDDVKRKALKFVHLNEIEIKSFQIIKRSIDARKKPEIFYIYTVLIEAENEDVIVNKSKSNDVSLATKVEYSFEVTGHTPLRKRPIIVGSGPAGLFCAYYLALGGYKPIILERGMEAKKRQQAINHFFETGELNEQSNVQFGEGGAGTFSDGKLNTLVKDKMGRNKEVLRILVEAGADPAILYDQKPHLGTDQLVHIITAVREKIENYGGEFRFENTLTDVNIVDGKLRDITVNHSDKLETDILILATGHSARDTFQMLYDKGISMEAKSFAVGLRVQHLQSMINKSQYGMEQSQHLGAAPYKLTAKASSGRGVYTFCMCPGGYVVNASSEKELLAINGMSYSGRDSECANSAVIISVTPTDFVDTTAGEGTIHPLAGIKFQRELEKKAYQVANGAVPIETYGDYVNHEKSDFKHSSFEPCMKGGHEWSDVRSILPESLNQSFIEGMKRFGQLIHGFDNEDTIVAGVESRTSSPVRILRDDNYECNIEGIYPCGEGAGYAGGITSAAMDGLKMAELLAATYAPFEKTSE